MKFIALVPVACLACIALSQAAEPPETWDMDTLSRVPAVRPAPGFDAPGVKALFFDGPPWKGKPTRVFAWYGVPAGERKEKAPGIVLVHGGGGTAFDEWVRLWTGRGYAAIAMDTCGCTPGGQNAAHPRHDLGGPPGWGGFDQIDALPADQWTYHAVAAVVLAHSLLRSFPEVDAGRIGITGISWGGYLTCIAAGVDARFRFAVPVYGCGFLGEDSCWLDTFKGMGEEKARKWLGAWDPSVYLPAARMPFLWVTGTNDFAYPMDSLRKSYRLPAGEQALCLRIRMPHGHGGPGENPEEILVFADAVLRGGVPLPEITGQGRDGDRAWAAFRAAPAAPVDRAELIFSEDGGPWQKREWKSAPAEVDRAAGKASAALPGKTRVWFFNVIDSRGHVTSSPHEER
jgi:dienelactone hydrolase